MVANKSTTKNQSLLHAQGVKRLNLIGKYSTQLMDAYIKGFFDEDSVSVGILNNLVDARILYRPDATQGLKLRPDVNKLIANLTEDERKRQINADVSSPLYEINTLVEHYTDAQRKDNYIGVDYYFYSLTEKVHDMTEQLSNDIEFLWNKLHADFGFVNNLSDKIRENELAQKQSQHLLNGLKIIDFNYLFELTQNNSKLRKLLVVDLQKKISELHSSLLEVQERLLNLMLVFRKQQKRLLLINNMVAFLKQNPNFEFRDYPNRSNVPDIFNKAASINASANIALDRLSDQSVLSEIVRSLPASVENHVEPLEVGNDFETTEIISVSVEYEKLKKDVTKFFEYFIEQNVIVSALVYLQNNKLDWDAELWLFQVIAEYEGLAQNFHQDIKFEKKKKIVSAFNQLEIIQDIHLIIVV
jgi:hypothetical protein